MRNPVFHSLRVAGVILVGSFLAGCSDLQLEQKTELAVVRPNPTKIEYQAKLVAGHFLPYALLSMAAYDETEDELEKAVKRGVGQGVILHDDSRWDDLYSELKRPLGGGPPQEWLRQWERIRMVSDKTCKPDEVDCGNWGGLGVNLWKRDDCSEVVIAFRGTDFRQATDWFSNLRWFTRIIPGYEDQYEKTKKHIAAWVDALKQRCTGTARIVAVGHSLGGGLAQQAAYADARIRHVYAFDSSMVTGYFSTKGSCDTARNLIIDRVYEHGEWLAYLRFAFRQVYPVSLRDPLIRNVRFNEFTEGSIFAQHSMARFTARLMIHAPSPQAWQSASKQPLPLDVKNVAAAECG